MHSDGVITVEGILRSIGFDEAAEGERRAGHARFRFRVLVVPGKADAPVQRPRAGAHLSQHGICGAATFGPASTPQRMKGRLRSDPCNGLPCSGAPSPRWGNSPYRRYNSGVTVVDQPTISGQFSGGCHAHFRGAGGDGTTDDPVLNA
jgi:hypothetical protein